MLPQVGSAGKPGSRRAGPRELHLQVGAFVPGLKLAARELSWGEGLLVASNLIGAGRVLFARSTAGVATISRYPFVPWTTDIHAGPPQQPTATNGWLL